jgi:hypothetical protein
MSLFKSLALIGVEKIRKEIVCRQGRNFSLNLLTFVVLQERDYGQEHL